MLLQDTSIKQKIITLDQVNSPEDIRDLSVPELEQLAAEIREVIIDQVATSGGHLGPSLGVVELTLALHYVFATPLDRLIWDVGHQAYAHKLITGRRDQFHTLRQYKGISGFPKIAESEYDAFETGHSSTSISAALGMALAKDITKQDGRAIAVIGDGSMTAGMAFEALNMAGHLDKHLIVVLNDNEMSISPNVGALSSFLSRKLSGRTMRRLKDHLVERLGQLSNVGEQILNVLKKSEDSFKSFFTPGMLFEALKFDYIGPIPGHQLDDLIDTLEMVRDTKHGPVLIHVLTKKGKGYEPAEKQPHAFHGIGPFDRTTGVKKKGNKQPITYTQAFGDAIAAIAEENQTVVAISAAMADGTGLRGFARRFPERFFDVGIAEQHAVTFGAGLAKEGMHPVIAIYSTFFQRSYDQIIHDVCLPKLPVTLAIDRAGVVGDDGPTHHGVFDMSFLRIVPNLVLMAPKDERELQDMLYTAIRHNGPCALRYPRGAGVGVELGETFSDLAIGKGELLRKGSDIVLLPVGNRVHPALAAASQLAEAGIDAAVINPRFIKPLDHELICDMAASTGRVMTIEDNAAHGGFGAAVLELLSQSGLSHIHTRILGHPDNFIEQGPQATLWSLSGIDQEGIVGAATIFVNNG
jgi:1-deoxy-D-xylulose-5-phosphate synthase